MQAALLRFINSHPRHFTCLLCLHIIRTHFTFLLSEAGSFYSRKRTSYTFALQKLLCGENPDCTIQFSSNLPWVKLSVRFTVLRLEMEQGKPEVGENFPHAERHAYRDDMGDSYGAAYTTRSADEGYGERYGEAVKAVLDKKAQKEGNMKDVQQSATSERDASADAEVHQEYDRTQGHPVAQLEHARHATSETSTKDKS